MGLKETTVDSIGDRKLQIEQHEDGFRFGLDAVLLATDLPELPDSPDITELGAGQGAVGLAVAMRIPDASLLAVERQESLFDLLESNIPRNDLTDRVEAKHLDIREHRDKLNPHSSDLVLANPPYFPEGERRPSSNKERAEARHELNGTLKDFVDTACYILDQRGYFKLIVPPRRLSDVISAIESTDLSMISLRFFHSREEDEAYLVEVLLRRGGGRELAVRPPLIIYAGAAEYTEEVQQRIESAAG